MTTKHPLGSEKNAQTFGSARCLGVCRRQAIGIRLLLGNVFFATVGNAQTLIPGISSSPCRNLEAWECASASGFFLGDAFILVQRSPHYPAAGKRSDIDS